MTPARRITLAVVLGITSPIWLTILAVAMLTAMLGIVAFALFELVTDREMP